jgi:hypothetical protein
MVWTFSIFYFIKLENGGDKFILFIKLENSVDKLYNNKTISK